MFSNDEKYLRYQVDRNLQYKCATCRGECYQVGLNECSFCSCLRTTVGMAGMHLIQVCYYLHCQVKDLEDAVQKLWRRRDKADRDLIASLRAAAGLSINFLIGQ